MKPSSSNRRSGSDDRLFGAITIIHDRDRQTAKIRLNPLRALSVLATLAVVLYAGAVSVGYVWLHQVRKLTQVSIADVALFQSTRVREKIGRDQFAEAEADWKAGKYQAAYIAFATALRNAPNYTDGRLKAVDFLLASGISSQAVTILEQGLSRDPQNEIVFAKTMEVLTRGGRDQEALTLIRSDAYKNATGDRALLLRGYELDAVMNLEGAVSAQKILEQNPALRARPASMLTVARIQWGTRQRLAAMETISNYLKIVPHDYGAYAQLVEYLEDGGMATDAQATAARACAAIPDRFEPRVLQLATVDPANPIEAKVWRAQLKSYFHDFGQKPEALSFLADVAGRKGWVSLALSIYENGINQHDDVRGLAIYYADALMHSGRAVEALDVLNTLDRQIPDDSALTVSLRQRQIVLAAQAGLHEDIRNYARKLASELGRDPRRLEIARRRFVSLGITEAVAELSAGDRQPESTHKSI